MEKIYTRIWILLLILLTDCITPYVPPVKYSTPLLVVNGLITDQPGPYVVNLSNTHIASDSYIRSYPSDAHVFIKDDTGNEEELKEKATGRFETSPTGIQGTAGRKYWIVVILKDGTRYESVPELLKPVPPIDEIYTVFQDLPNNPGLVGKFRAYVSMRDSEKPGDYYKWTWMHYSFKPYCNQYTIDGDLGHKIYREECCEPCWNVEQCESCINVLSDHLANGQKVDRYLMEFPYDSKEPYYLMVQQSSLSEGAYEFWSSLNDQVNSAGGVFDPPRTAVRGNVFNTGNSQEQVLGYFGASGQAKAIQYLSRDGIEKPPILPFSVFTVLGDCVKCKESYFLTTKKPEGWVD
jgi:hypothetical protein